eukprot:15324577-Ditylum_brightwellii.AAC.1
MIFNLKKQNPDGFIILKSIIFDLSLHLGGKGPDVQERIDSFHISSEETLYEVQSRSIQLLDILNIIQAIPETTTHINKFIVKCITHLQSQPDLNIKSIKSKHILEWHQFPKQCLISNSQCYATSLGEIYEELIDSGIPTDVMLQPISVPTTIPKSTMTASTSLPRCQADAEGQLSIVKQVLNHDKCTCLLLNNANIRDKSICEAVKQNNAKNPSQNSEPKRDLDYQRKSPHLTIVPSPKVKSILLNHGPQIIQYNIHDPPHLTEEDEEHNENQSETKHDDDDPDYEDPDDTSQDQEQVTLPLQP